MWGNISLWITNEKKTEVVLSKVREIAFVVGWSLDDRLMIAWWSLVTFAILNFFQKNFFENVILIFLCRQHHFFCFDNYNQVFPDIVEKEFSEKIRKQNFKLETNFVENHSFWWSSSWWRRRCWHFNWGLWLPKASDQLENFL